MPILGWMRKAAVTGLVMLVLVPLAIVFVLLFTPASSPSVLQRAVVEPQYERPYIPTPSSGATLTPSDTSPR